MWRSVVLFVLVVVAGCTNDYGSFRFPRTQTPVSEVDAGDAGGGALDGG